MIEDRVFWVVVAALFGGVIGSFLNVVIYRMPRKIGLVGGRSNCPHCGCLISWWQNIPVLSYLMLHGRCRGCREAISVRYPLVEIMTALTFAGWVIRLGLSVEALGYIYLSCVLICVLFIDWEFQIIPDRLTLPAILVGWLWAAFAPLGLWPSVLGIGDWLFRKESMGGGDIKLAAVLGAFLGWHHVVLVFFLSALIGALGSGIWLLVSREMRQSRMIPFGPFLAVAAVLAALWGDEMITWYVRTFWLV
jgi:leader peptidase (prepilin peptidase)/N-methyltransferase